MSDQFDFTPVMLVHLFDTLLEFLKKSGSMFAQNVTSADKQAQPLHHIDGLPPAPDFSLQDLDGLTHKLSDYWGAGGNR